MIAGAATQVQDRFYGVSRIPPEGLLQKITFRFIVLVPVEGVIIISVAGSELFTVHLNTCLTAAQTSANWLSVRAIPDGR